jgi:hypothetical protein
LIVRLPAPVAPLVIDNQLAELVAVALHVLPVVRLMLPVDTDVATVRAAGESEYVQAPFCVMLRIAEPTVSVADLAEDEPFAATLYLTVPFPLPLGVLMVSQPAELVAVHAHPLEAVTVAEPVDEVFATVTVPGETL